MAACEDECETMPVLCKRLQWNRRELRERMEPELTLDHLTETIFPPYLPIHREMLEKKIKNAKNDVLLDAIEAKRKDGCEHLVAALIKTGQEDVAMLLTKDSPKSKECEAFECQLKSRLLNEWQRLIECVDKPVAILDMMATAFPPHRDTYDHIVSQRLLNDQRRSLLSAIMLKGEVAYKAFIEALRDSGQRDLAAALAKEFYPDLLQTCTR